MRPDPAVYFPARSGAVLGDTLGYFIRGEHAEQIWLAVGDTLDVVLTRLKCAGNWCGPNPGMVAAQWALKSPALADLLPLKDPRWRFGAGPATVRAGAAGVRLVARAPGVSSVLAQVPETTLHVPVIVVPRTVRLRIVPRTVTVRAGDTAWVVIAALDERGRTVAYLPHPFWGGAGQSMRPNRAGRVGVVLQAGWRDGLHPFVVRLGRHRADTLFVRVESP